MEEFCNNTLFGNLIALSPNSQKVVALVPFIFIPLNILFEIQSKRQRKLILLKSSLNQIANTTIKLIQFHFKREKC